MRVSNRYSWRAVFEQDLWDERDVPAQREMIVEVILRYVRGVTGSCDRIDSDSSA